MAKKPTKWRRDLTEPEKRVNFIQLEERWNTSEEVYVDQTTPVARQVVSKLIADLGKIIDDNDIRSLNDIKMGFRDKLINVIKQNLFNAYKIGKAQALDEFKINKEIVFSEKDKAFISARAEVIVDDMLGRTKTNCIFTTLNGMRAGKNKKQIIIEVKGDPYGITS